MSSSPIRHLLLCIGIISLSNILVDAQQQPECPDFSPACVCGIGLYGISVECKFASSMDEIKAVFNRTQPIDVYDLRLFIRPSGDSILADLL